MILTYEYRLLPSRRQQRVLEAILESQRVLYNAALQERIGAYRHGVKLGLFDQQRSLTQWRHCDPEAACLALNVQRATLKRLDEAFRSFFRRLNGRSNAGFPRFRGTQGWSSFGFREFVGIDLDGTALRFKGMPGRLKVHLHRPFPDGARICSCTLVRDGKGWKIGFDIEFESKPPRTARRCVGVDLGISNFAVLSDGGRIPSLRAARRMHRRLRVAQRSLARKVVGSEGRKRAKAQLAGVHASIRRARSSHLHAGSARLVRDYDVVAVEAINVAALARSVLARDVRDASWSRFLSMLRYKAERAGARIIEVDPYNSSQDCSGCGKKVAKGLAERWHDCPHCLLLIDRDLNAARNILGRAGVSPCLPNVAQ